MLFPSLAATHPPSSLSPSLSSPSPSASASHSLSLRFLSQPLTISVVAAQHPRPPLERKPLPHGDSSLFHLLLHLQHLPQCLAPSRDFLGVWNMNE